MAPVQGLTKASSGSRVRSLASVEVRKNAEATTWYDAELRDVIGRRTVLSFAEGVWPTREVPCDSVRPAQPALEPPAGSSLLDTLMQKVSQGDAVEFRVAASARNPPGWAIGKLLGFEAAGLLRVAIGHGYPETANNTLLLTPAMVRPVSVERVIDPLSTVRQVVWVEPMLRSWLGTPDARGCCELVQGVAGLGLVGAGSGARGIGLSATSEAVANDDDSEQFDAVILLGPEASCRRGEMLLRIHMMHQKEVEAFHERRRRKLKHLNEQLQLPEHVVHSSFDVAADLVGRTVGKGGVRAQRVEEEYGVEIRVVDGRREGDPCHIRILGDDEKSVEKARDELELLCQDYPVDEDRVGWMLGKGKSNIQDMARKTGLAHLKWTGTSLELCGSYRSLEDVVLLLDSHAEYYDVYQEMSRQNEEIERSFDALDVAAENAGLMDRRRGPESKGRGKSREPQGRRKDDAGAQAAPKQRPRSAGRKSGAGKGGATK